MLSVDQQPLVSVVVITYNSAKYVLETLESIKAQTYQNIELIISDDCSKDDTVILCERWLKNNSDRFSNFEIIISKQNTGISPNCNRGAKKVNGKWLKLIAGDDLLTPNCLDVFIHATYVSSCKVWICGMEVFLNDGTIVRNSPPPSIPLKQDQQVRFILRKGAIIPGPALFICTSTLKSMGYYDETYRFIEDLPLVYKMIKSGDLVGILDEVLVRYREHSLSITNSSHSDSLFTKELNDFYLNVIIPDCWYYGMYFFWWDYVVKFYFLNRFRRFSFINYLVNPMVYVRFFHPFFRKFSSFFSF